MSYGIWPEWMIYSPPSSVDLGVGAGRGNVIRDVAREVLSAISGLTLLGPQEGVVWRGQADCSWRLESKMGRLGMTAAEMARRERAMLRETREIGVENAQHLGDWEILARLRHHGAATRLIDFTTDPLVALWFLCEDGSALSGGDTLRDTPGVLLATQRRGLGTVPMPYSRNYSTTLKQSGNLLYKTPPIDPRIAAQRGGVWLEYQSPLEGAVQAERTRPSDTQPVRASGSRRATGHDMRHAEVGQPRRSPFERFPEYNRHCSTRSSQGAAAQCTSDLIRLHAGLNVSGFRRNGPGLFGPAVIVADGRAITPAYPNHPDEHPGAASS